MKMRVKFFYFSVILTIKIGFSQNEKITNYIYEGNKNSQTEAFVEAEKSYRKALSLSPEKPEALYNLGNTHFLDKQYDEASQRFFQTQKNSNLKEEKHAAFHNLGNVYMQQKDYTQAVEAFKNGLRNNPKDEETRYNYALAKELLEKEKQDLVYENERLNLKLSMLLDKSNSSINEQSFIEKDGFVDTSNLDKKINDLNAQINKLNSEIDIIKRESLEWQVQYSEISKEKEELAIELNSKRNI